MLAATSGDGPPVPLRGRAAAAQALQQRQQGAVGAADGAGDAASTPRLQKTRDAAEQARKDYQARMGAARSYQQSRGSTGSALSAQLKAPEASSDIHSRLASLESAWNEMQGWKKANPLEAGSKGVSVSSGLLARNRTDLESETDACLRELWDSVSGGSAGVALNTGMASPDSPMTRGARPGEPWLTMEARGMTEVQLKELQKLRGDMERIELDCRQVCEEEDQRLPPPPPLVEKKPTELQAWNRAEVFDSIASHLNRSQLGCVADSGGTPMLDPDSHIGYAYPKEGQLGVVRELAALEQEVGNVRKQVQSELAAHQKLKKHHQLMWG